MRKVLYARVEARWQRWRVVSRVCGFGMEAQEPSRHRTKHTSGFRPSSMVRVLGTEAVISYMYSGVYCDIPGVHSTSPKPAGLWVRAFVYISTSSAVFVSHRP